MRPSRTLKQPESVTWRRDSTNCGVRPQPKSAGNTTANLDSCQDSRRFSPAKELFRNQPSSTGHVPNGRAKGDNWELADTATRITRIRLLKRSEERRVRKERRARSSP